MAVLEQLGEVRGVGSLRMQRTLLIMVVMPPHMGVVEVARWEGPVPAQSVVEMGSQAL